MEKEAETIAKRSTFICVLKLSLLVFGLVLYPCYQQPRHSA